MKSKNCQKVVLKALGHILYGSNFIASDVTTVKELLASYTVNFLDFIVYEFSKELLFCILHT